MVAPLKQPVVVTYDGKDYTLSPKQLHETADVDGMVQEAIDRSRQGNILDRVTRYATGGKVNANLEPRVSYDKSAVKHFVKQLADQIDQDPGRRDGRALRRRVEAAEAGRPGGPRGADRAR